MHWLPDASGRRSLLATGQPKSKTFKQCFWDDRTDRGCANMYLIPMAVDSDIKPLDVYLQ
jgi:hypothetical protein